MKPILLFSIMAVLWLLLIPICGRAQLVAVGQQSSAQWRVTESEVVAVQTELKRRGFYRTKPSGVLDNETREAVRAYQAEQGLKASGRIDRSTYQRLGLAYPATGKERQSQRRSGTLPSIGYGVKDTAVTTRQTVGGVAGKVKNGTVTGYTKTKEVGQTVVAKTKEMGGTAARTVKTMGRPNRSTAEPVATRSDPEIQAQVREIMNLSPETQNWFSDVKGGMVTVKTPPDPQGDIGGVVSGIRKIAGVKSVFVIAE
ncbi:MAG TPA: peptidoglycan-binding domain-containing protein [Blastocatellia bacterium]|nr:peptidoglycan-binding domain-containing protein [Blastocatellia bacterium]